MASVVTPIRDLYAPRGRTLARGLLHLLPIALALAIVAWWPRPRAERPPAAAASPTLAEQERKLSGAIERARASTVALEYGSGDAAGGRRVATGVVISDEGDVLSVRVDPTEKRDRESIRARDSAGHRHSARWVAADPETGLTLLKVDADDLRPIRPAARAAVLGAAVFVIGNPYGLGHSVSRGHVAGLARRLEIGSRPLGGLIQLQTPLHPGDSGALLADLEGGWLGMVRGGVVTTGARDDDDLGFAIPAPDAMWVAGQLQERGKVDRAYLGIKLAPDGDEPGAEVAEVNPGSPAERAGLAGNDRIVRIEGRPIRTTDDLTDRLDRTPAGAEVAIEVLRGPARNRLLIRTAARPVKPTPPADPAPPPTPPAKPADPAPAAVPRELIERLERLERLVEDLRKREPAGFTP